MLDYDREADRYDATRGGQVRADAAASAVTSFFGPDVSRVLDVGAGTGIVSAAVATDARQVYGLDASAGMLGKAADRLPGRRVCALGTSLPIHDGAFDAVYAMWLLHLVPDAPTVVAECMRVLRPGGLFVTTVDLHAAHLAVACDVNEVMARYVPVGWQEHEPDARSRVLDAAQRSGGEYVGETTYPGHGRGESPSGVMRGVGGGRWPGPGLGERERTECVRELERLPDQDRRRPDPTYTLVAVRRGVRGTPRP